jgi:nitroreductase
MNPSIQTLIETRVSTQHYDTQRPLSDAQVSLLVDLAARAPSAYNFQNWKFIAVRSAEAKARLHAVSYNQQQVLDAPVTYIICGKLDAHKGLPSALMPSVVAGLLDQSTFDGWVAMAQRSHQDSPTLQRDEAMRSASLAAMTLMLAAQGMGLSTGAMSGFDPEGVTAAFDLSVTELPVILVTVGYATTGHWRQKPRKPVHEVMAFA